MKLFLPVMFTAAALLVQPIVDESFGGSFRPDLRLAALAICVSLCPGAPAVICGGLVGLILDCLTGPHLGARAAAFSVLAGLGSAAVGRRPESWPRRVAIWAVILFVAGLLSRFIVGAFQGVPFRLAAAIFDSALCAATTMILLCALWWGAELLLRGPRAARSNRRFAPAIGRALGED
jgi:rod shape-determining protein MreD